MGIKITRKLLDEYRDKIRPAIIVLASEIKMMEDRDSDYGVGNSVIMDYRGGYPRPQSVVAKDWESYDHKREKLIKKQVEVSDIEEWINEIEDDVTRNVFHMFYTERKSWKEIAAICKYYGDADNIRKTVRDKYFSEKKIK